MSFKRNIIANYLSQIYVSLIGIVMAPMYLHYMGIEAYGLVGFYAAIQIWFGLLDMGLSLTLVRETARFRAKALNVLTYRRLVFALELIFVGVGAFGGLFLYCNSSRLANDQRNCRNAMDVWVLSQRINWDGGIYMAKRI